MKEKRKVLDPADLAAMKEARIKRLHDSHLDVFKTLSDTEMLLDLRDRMAGNSAPVAGNSAPVAGNSAPVTGSPETPKSVTGSPETPKSMAGSQKAPKSAGGGSSATAGPQDLVTKERARELRKQLKQLKAWLDTECMTRDQYKFARISIDKELRTAKGK